MGKSRKQRREVLSGSRKRNLERVLRRHSPG
jgi:hypothetical protein